MSEIDLNITANPFPEPELIRDIVARFYAIEVEKAITRPWLIGRPKDHREIATHMLMSSVCGLLAAASSRTGLPFDKARTLAEQCTKLILQEIVAANTNEQQPDGPVDESNGGTVSRGPGDQPEPT